MQEVSRAHTSVHVKIINKTNFINNILFTWWVSMLHRWYEDRKPTRCYRMVLLNLRFAQHVSGTIMPIIRSLRLYRCSQHVAHNLGYVPNATNICIVPGAWA